ncbi:succinyldiaminopimelate transaminase [Thiohalophilus thiocyanatoxydans]|uniref:Succinyldiaminopimelate aminotransferase n=1 Tax=Thiohalophilus thiocyanatoxydans TaxID=381308 RepID=A0A4R8IHN8_9GAMM|nr:succinyldiaminopimelate transaminase [Thiohalophilus thiocyanatoxydans]TDY00102.1 succinyldiaminopimelate aminotransferase [Thiohalophilus thiocyanatoxydans]
MNPELDKLHPYPFEKLARLKDGVTPPGSLAHIALSIGEPKHDSPAFVFDVIRDSLATLASYPLTRGSPALREAIVEWLNRRFQLPADLLDSEHHVLPVNGTREALFAFAQAVVERGRDPLVLMPNPFYQIYEGAALLAGAEPGYLNCEADNGFIPDFDAVSEQTWARCQLLYLCSPGNPTGAVLDQATLIKLMELAERHDFVIAADECYSEIYFDETQPPVGLLQAAAAAGNDQFKQCVVFHSLSKRSNLPGLRSGFVAGDAEIIAAFHRYRTYHGCAMPPHHQIASVAAWSDEQHVRENRQLYRRKFDAVLAILQPVMSVSRPEAGFYLWPRTPLEDTGFARRLYGEQNVTVLPGQYLSRNSRQTNPGRNRVRMALVADLEECVEAAGRIKNLIDSL